MTDERGGAFSGGKKDADYSDTRWINEFDPRAFIRLLISTVTSCNGDRVKKSRSRRGGPAWPPVSPRWPGDNMESPSTARILLFTPSEGLQLRFRGLGFFQTAGTNPHG